MATNVAPWLQGLSDEAWEQPQQQVLASSVSSASHDASSLRNSQSRIPRRSLSGLPSSLSRQPSASHASTQRKRNPLAPLSNNDANTLRRQASGARPAATSSVSEASEGSFGAYGTVQQRSKSASPSKKQETMEWKRRLVNGRVGYGDQTDLFGPSGLENIFAKSKDDENESPKPKSRMNWLQKSSDIPMPSSPPPRSSNRVGQTRQTSEESLNAVEEEDAQAADAETFGADESFRSNPFDLESRDAPSPCSNSSQRRTTQYQSSPNKAFIEVTEDEPAGNRTVSGQTELDQEDFSPVFITKHHTVTGQVGYTALDSHTIKQFQSMKVDLRHPSQEHFREHSDSDEQQELEKSAFTDGPETQDQPAAPDLSFSENLPTGSPVPNLGTHVELRRGGYSQYGSFRRKPLSPSQSTMALSTHPDASTMLSPILSEPYERSPTPTTPRRSGVEADTQEPISRPSGSPLKLFGAHDTFTNNRLLRRMSQLNPDGTLRQPADVARQGGTEGRRVTSNGSFGQGELNDHRFNAEITVTSASDSSGKGSDESPGSEILVPGSKAPMAFRFELSSHVTETYKLKRKLSKHSTANSKGSQRDFTSGQLAAMQPTVEDASISQLQVEPDDEPPRNYAEGKRPPTSPFKSPTPKRRRTLHASELEDYMTRVNDTYHSQLQEAVSTRKRKDARHGDTQITADPETLAQRKILRPRNPTPSQCRRQQIEAELREAAEEFAAQEPEKMEAVLEQIESSMTSDSPQTLEQQAQAVATEVAAFTLKVQRPSGEHGERKRSVTTQDFLNEAMMVMNLIRAKARPRSNLGSVEESDAEPLGLSARIDGSMPDDSMLRVSRPPSREGSGWRQRPLQTDARVVSHLRKFQEQDERDDTDFIANSIASLQVDDEQINDQVIIVDEHSNIRITGPPSDRGKTKKASDSQPNSQRSQGSTAGTQTSNATSTERTIGTSSTRKSDNVGTLAPDAVAHLIGEQVGGMTFDKEQQRWVRVSRSPAKSHGSFLELPSNVTSDDDPFREISDLPVDEHHEMRRISSPAKVAQEQAAAEAQSSVRDQAINNVPNDHDADIRVASHETVIARPVTQEGAGIRHNHSSSVPSRYTAFASSQQQQEKVETRATSWSDEELARMSAFGKAMNQPLQYAAAEVAMARRSADEAEEQRSYTFSTINGVSVPAEPAEDSEDPLADIRDDTALEFAERNIEDIDSPKLRQRLSEPIFQPPTQRTTTRHISLRRQTLTTRFNAEPQEHSELSFVAPLPGDRMMSLQLSVSRPVSNRHQPWAAELQSSPSKISSSFMLSDLPEFTVHEEDAEKPSERALATRLAQHAAADVNDRYALARKELVKTLTDVNQSEPYWEDLKQLDVHQRSLASLHGLNDFCTRVQEMDASNNVLTHLEGLPHTVRRLDVRSNQLSNLTSWNNLMNLQYLDISNNQLRSLDALNGLIHLRELRADDNKISSLAGLFELDGLLKLRARRNELREVDFAGCQLGELTSLDLSHNGISSVAHLDTLYALKELILDGNILPHGLQAAQAMPHLTSLSMKDCKMEHLDVSNFPALTHLVVDDNCLTNIDGLSQLKNLQLLSMKRQDLSEGVQLSLFDQSFDTRTLRLSGTAILSINLAASFLSIQHLEMASVGLQELPDDFGLRMPNLRTLNLNFNNLKDIRPLLNIQNLRHLKLCSNRLYRLRKSVATVAKLKSLQTLDLRDNPLTQGFYPTLASTLSKNTCLVHQSKERNMCDEDENTSLFESARYQYPAADIEQDKQYRSRLDEDTKLRRRVHEMLLAYSCHFLTELDGLKMDRMTAVTRDSVWNRLVDLGVVRRSQHCDELTTGDRSVDENGNLSMRLLS